MIQLNPSQIYPLIYKISDPLDVTTYYVQAVVKNARTLATLATINLTDNGSQLFSNNYQVPPDTSGQGLFINIQITVYTDALHTTVSPNYQISNQTFLVQERFNLAAFGGTGSSVDYKKIQEMIDNSRPEMPEIPTHKADLAKLSSEVFGIVTLLKKHIGDFGDYKVMISEQLQTIVSNHETQLQTIAEKLSTLDTSIMPADTAKELLEMQTQMTELEAKVETDLNTIKLEVAAIHQKELDKLLEQFIQGFMAVFMEFRQEVIADITTQFDQLNSQISDKRYIAPMQSKSVDKIKELAQSLLG